MSGNFKKTAYMGMAAAAALMLSYIETLIPFYFGIPGMKLGLPNLLVVLILYLYGGREAFAVNAARILLNTLLFGSLFGFFYSIAGAFCSFAVMLACKKTNRFSIAGVSIAGGITHNIGQCIVAVFVVHTMQVLYYMPFLIAAGALTGMILGAAAGEVLKKINRDA